MGQAEREEDYIIKQMDSGELTQKEGQRQLDEIFYDRRAMAEESAQRAYDDEMSRW